MSFLNCLNILLKAGRHVNTFSDIIIFPTRERAGLFSIYAFGFSCWGGETHAAAPPFCSDDALHSGCCAIKIHYMEDKGGSFLSSRLKWESRTRH